MDYYFLDFYDQDNDIDTISERELVIRQSTEINLIRVTSNVNSIYLTPDSEANVIFTIQAPEAPVSTTAELQDVSRS